MTTIRTFTNQADAAVCLSALRAGGFEAVLLDEASNAWIYSGQAVPIRLQVPDEQAEEASAFLASADSKSSDL